MSTGSRDGKMLLMGNEAIARGLIEGGLQVAASYPGTPSTEVMETLLRHREEFGIYAEWSVNEKVAAEVAISASMCGARASVSMKGVGLNVAAEPIQAYTYMRVEGGLCVVTADDPGMHSSHNEQDNRVFARAAFLPTLEPYDPESCRVLASRSLPLSERWGQPLLLRSTTLVSHMSAPVTPGAIPERTRAVGFMRAPIRWVNLPSNARRMKCELMERMERIRGEAETIDLNSVEGSSDPDLGVIACGGAYLTVRECVDRLGAADRVSILRLGLTHPLPPRLISRFLGSVPSVLVAEEVDPVVETEVRAIAQQEGIDTPIAGRSHLPSRGELALGDVLDALKSSLGLAGTSAGGSPMVPGAPPELPIRPPQLCAGCGHRNVFFAMNLAERRCGLRGRMVRPSDIGCYTLGYNPPLNAVDTNLCMGSSVGVASGFGRFGGGPVVCTIGDSTFFHAGIPPLLNAVFNASDLTVIVLDNSVTAMTGHQPNPGSGRNVSGPAERVRVEDLARACGVSDVRVVDVHDLDGLVDAISHGVTSEGVSVVVAQGECALLAPRKGTTRYTVDPDACTRCLLCMTKFGCPAFLWDGESVRIDAGSCNGCGVCSNVEVCRPGAIRPVDGGEER